ncbi:MAG: TonB-dependent receptor [Candidatus Acidiferrales bacterium]
MNIKKAWILGILFLAVLVAFAPSVMAQESASKGSLNGTVVDSTGGAIVGAQTTLMGPQGNQSKVTNGSGTFIYQDLIPGNYKLSVEMKGFRRAEVSEVVINVGRVSAIRVQLEPGSVTSTVEVVSSAVTVDTASTAVATNLNDDFYNKLPVQRNVAGLFYLAPGVVSGGGTGASNPSIGGATGLENLYIADGVSITDTAFGGLGIYSRVYGSLGTGINLSFIKEVQVKTGSIQSQYGGATGGVVQIVTKSGGNQYHGAVAGYWQPNAFEAARLNPDSFGLANPFGSLIHNSTADVSGELGGPVPGLKDKLFFFGSFDPTLLGTTQRAAPLSGISAFGDLTGRTYSYNYAAKLTFKLNDRNTIEGSVFGDPSHRNNFPWFSLAEGVNGIPNRTSFSNANFGNRDVVARYNGTLSPTWVVNLDATWQNNHFTEGGYDNSISAINDQTQTAAGPIGNGTIMPGIQQGNFFAVGRGFVENTEDDSYGAHINTSKIVNFWGQHSVDVGYGYNRPFYKGVRANSGPAITPPLANEDGGSPSGQCTGGPCPWAGEFSNYLWRLLPASAVDSAVPCLSCPIMNVPGVGPEPVILSETRGEFGVASDGFEHFSTTGRTHSAYLNDSWTINKYVTLNAGIRWQQERLIGENANYTFTDNWSPALGVTIDPIGDRKNKIWFSFGRYNYNLPLDLAERSLTNEKDLFNLFLAPDYVTAGTNGCVPTVFQGNTYNRCVVLNSSGTVTPIVDPAHDLNHSANGIPIGIFGSGSSLEAIHTATRLTYEDEYVIGAEHQFSRGLVLTARYMHRSLRRIVEDTGGISPEAALAGVPQQFSITNPSKNLDIFTNPVQVDYIQANGLPAACGTGNFNIFPLTNSVGIAQTDSQGNDSACFAEGIDASTGQTVPVGINGCPSTGPCTAAGSVTPDGIPDGFADPIHKYWSMVFEVNKSFSHNWQLRANYTISKVFGNFEGAFRNDNGQSDPGISSLFDFTPGNFGLLGNQFTPGILSENHQQVANGYFSYVFDHGMLKNLTLGTGVTVSTGTPISELAAHPVYQNAGEVPIGGRGSQGTTPTTGRVDFHGDYVMNVTEKMHLRFGVDLFNIANTKRTLFFNQNLDLGLGVSNADFLKPANLTGAPISASSGIQSPFNARVFARFEF